MSEPDDASRLGSYRLAFEDLDFLRSPAARPARLELELLKPEVVLDAHRIRSTIVVFGSARIPSPEQAQADIGRVREEPAESLDEPGDRTRESRARRRIEQSRYYDEARRFATLVSSCCQGEECECVMVTGGGPGIMEAANRGASEVGKKSIALNIDLPREQHPNPYATPDLTFRFRYFAIRKMHFLLRAMAAVFFPGGFGTLDELFELLTLRQTGKVPPMPVVLIGRDHWSRLLDLEFLVEEGFIDAADLEAIEWAETAEQAWEIIRLYRDRQVAIGPWRES